MRNGSSLTIRCTGLPGYCHALEGRLRLYIPEVKRAPQRALFVDMLLGSMDGVIRSSANPTTGNVLVLFDPNSLAHEDIIAALRKAGCLGVETPPDTALGLADFVRGALVRSIADAFVHRALSAIW
ncbi:MAG TPA: hypothetical protein VJ746_02965 [Nitrospira sp.]|nr:hypothetical protein [Nitrospira sp.]